MEKRSVRTFDQYTIVLQGFDWTVGTRENKNKTCPNGTNSPLPLATTPLYH